MYRRWCGSSVALEIVVVGWNKADQTVSALTGVGLALRIMTGLTVAL